MFDRLAELPLQVERHSFERLTSGERITTLLRLHGRGQEGCGEDIMPSPEDHDAFERLPLDLAGSWPPSSRLSRGYGSWKCRKSPAVSTFR